MDGFDPKTSFGYQTSKHYDLHETRGDEKETVAFLVQLARSQDALELAVGTGRIALPLLRAGVLVDGIEQSQHMVDRMREKPGGDSVRVVIGDMSRASTGRRYGLVYLVYNTIGNLLTQQTAPPSIRSAFAWPTHPSSTSWRGSPVSASVTEPEAGSTSRSPPPAGATSASTNESPSCPRHAIATRSARGEADDRLGRFERDVERVRSPNASRHIEPARATARRIRKLPGR